MLYVVSKSGNPCWRAVLHEVNNNMPRPSLNASRNVHLTRGLRAFVTPIASEDAERIPSFLPLQVQTYLNCNLALADALLS
jgi:hypothetical protein